ncbi:ATP-binding cassette, subfamily B, MsbA [Chitinophaga jiangningensis]|uniref:ATP-binding cassette, subfamily B, MsbA n=1 Tax=Chitinophaga jiangningensis TaxID=1419482 RepID=A0A1M7DTL6_9BACT|nr:ABC transporter ATP-binding protein [Chitinophaga jiangningensis]SHL82723.1 ATP-binding cassette, subfamily B, MsbA [Chitinophaga jiangningensis]
MKTFKRLLRYATPLHHYLPEYVIYTIIGIIFGLVNFSALIPLLNLLFDQVSPEEAAKNLIKPTFSLSIDYFIGLFKFYLSGYILEDKMRALIFVGLFIGATTTIANVGRYMSARVITRLRMNMLEKVRNDLYKRLTEQSLSFFHNRKKGELLTVISSDVQEIESNVVNGVQVLLRDPFIILVYFAGLFYLSTKLTLFTIFFFPVSGLIISFISKKLKQKGHFSQEWLSKTISVFEESISGVRIIQSFSATRFMQRKFGNINHQFIGISRSMYNQRELASPISEILGVAVILILIIYGGSLVIGANPTMQGAEFMTYLIFYSQILQPAKNISTAITNLQKGLVSSERIFDILDAPVEITEKPGAEPIKTFENSIVYKDVDFSYGQTPVLKNVNLTIAKGQIIALVGRSGAGKSTMADILPRFYDVKGGSVSIDGKDVKDLKLDDLRGLMGVVSQQAILFNDTVFNNIAFGYPDAKLEDVIRAAKIANAHEFIERLENGYETSIGDSGMKLSGGQRQRLTIARAVFKNPPIMILDEATSALDTESEKLVQEALDKLMENRTTVVIAHRLSTIQHATEIIVMEQGEIVERGNHQELLANDGIYKRLVEMQEFK